MAAITEDAIRELAGFKGKEAPVTSCYLDVDGRRFVRHQEYEHRLDGLIRQGKGRANGTTSVHNDLRRIEQYVKAGVDRSQIRGLAFFACSAHDLFQVVALPVPVHNQMVVNDVPAVGQLEAVVQDRNRIGVLLADRQRARVLVFDLGELKDHSELLDELPRDYDIRGEKERGDVSNHVDALAHQHLRRAAQVAFDVFRSEPFDHLCIGAPEELAGQVESALHPYLRERLCGRVTLTPAASLDQIRGAAEEIDWAVERRQETRAVERLRAAVGSGRRGAAGLGDVLSALNAARVDLLLVSRGYGEAGWKCPGDGTLWSIGPSCKACDGPMERLDDVVEEALDLALTQGCRVEICTDNADLDVMGRIGALLRF